MCRKFVLQIQFNDITFIPYKQAIQLKTCTIINKFYLSNLFFVFKIINICFTLSFYLLSSKITVNICQFLANNNTTVFRKYFEITKTNDFYIIGFLLYSFIRMIFKHPITVTKSKEAYIKDLRLFCFVKNDHVAC